MAKYEIYALKYAGPVSSSGAFLMWLKDWEKIEERNYYIWCLKRGEEAIVVDAGVRSGLAAEKRLPCYVDPGVLLSRIGVRADLVKHVVITHAHWDHVNGVEFFPRALFYLQTEEYRFWMKDTISTAPPFSQLLDEGSKRNIQALKKSGRLLLIDGDKGILPGIDLILSPGHSVALQSVLVDTWAGKAVIASDTGHVFRNCQEKWPSSIFVDLVALLKTYDKIVNLASSPRLVFPGHDVKMSTDYPRIAENITRLA